jgi:hypothetical protein
MSFSSFFAPLVSNIGIENLARREPDQGLSVKAAPVFVIRITL